MDEILKYILTTIKNDSTISTLTGKDVNDPRIYSLYPERTTIFSDAKPAAMFYYIKENQLNPEFSYPVQIGDMNIKFKIVSVLRSNCINISERMRTIFLLSSIKTDNYRVGNITTGVEEIPAEGTATRTYYNFIFTMNLTSVFKKYV